jgi:hypothetical protein
MSATRVTRWFGLGGAVVFAAVGLVFLLMPKEVPVFFNALSAHIGMKQSPVEYPGFFLILAAAYMYVVTVISYKIFRYPENPVYLLLLANAKAASSVLSLVLLVRDDFYLVYLANFIVDGCIAGAAFYLYARAAR